LLRVRVVLLLTASWCAAARMLGDALMVAPVLDQGATSVTAYFPAGVWYSLYDFSAVDATGGGRQIAVPVRSPRSGRTSRHTALRAADADCHAGPTLWVMMWFLNGRAHKANFVTWSACFCMCNACRVCGAQA